MKKTFFLLTIIPLFTLSGLASPLDFGKKWPIYWNQFKIQPKEENKVFKTVKFTKSIDEACSIFQKASIRQKSKWEEYNKVLNELELQSYKYSSSEEYTQARLKKTEYINLPKFGYIRVSTAVEVLRQSGYKDWKLYSRYNSFGVGDLWRERAEKKLSVPESKKKYSVSATYEASEICEIFGYKIPFAYMP